MADRLQRIDGFLGRLVFRAFGIGCAIIAAVCAYAAWWHLDHQGEIGSVVPFILFSLASLAAASCVPYCFSRKRSFVEALDAMEGGVGDQPRRP